MAKIVILTHEDDEFARRGYLVATLAGHWTKAGHHVSVVAGTGPSPKGDLAILHVDRSVLPEAYAKVAKRFGSVINGATTDIRKRAVSLNLLGPKAKWTGPVIIKTDLNCGGLPERRHYRTARRRGAPSGWLPEPVSIEGSYEVLPSLREVPKAVWSNPGLVVEKFLPEQDERGYWTRVWVFLGDREWCRRYFSRDSIVKRSNITSGEVIRVPPEIRAERERLGFDYGKFDFVVRDGKAILFDANRTPTTPPPGDAAMPAANAGLAKGIEAFLK